MTVKLYRYGGKDIVVNKTLPSSGADYLAITADYGFEGNQDVDTPSIIIESASKPTYNYAYIQELGRYYFVTSCVWLSGQLWRLNLRCDVLKTYATEISGLSGTFIYSGSGDSRRYDPRLVYNLPPVKTAISPTTLNDTADTTGEPVYIVMTCRFMDKTLPDDITRASNQMSYLIFTPKSYQAFTYRLYGLTLNNEQLAVAVSNTICSVTVVRWLNMSGFTKKQNAQFRSPEICKIQGNGDYYEMRVDYFSLLEPTPPPGTVFYDFYQLSAEEYFAKSYIAFADTALSYADRKAQRLVDIPYVGQLNLDLDNLELPSLTGYYLCVEIGYDLGGNEYVVSLGIGATSITNASSVAYQRVDYTTFPNTYSATFITDSSYSAEKESRTSQLLSLIGTAAAGIVSGIVTEGATIPATVASLGIGAANFALNEQKIEYQKAASMKVSGTSNGGSAYNTFITRVVTPQPHIQRPAAVLYKKITNSSTDPTNFAAAYGKPDGAFRTVLSLAGTGFAQMGAVTLSGFSTATEQEKIEIKNLLMSGVIL